MRIKRVSDLINEKYDEGSNPKKERVITKVKASNNEDMEGGKEFDCLWDTGATATLISKKVINALKLEKKGTSKISTIHGEENSDVYEILLLLPKHKKPLKVTVASFDKRDGFDILIGMDIIQHGKFTLNNGTFDFVMSDYK